MNQLSFRVGCEACKAQCAGVYQLAADKQTRADIVESIEIAVELTGVPIGVLMAAFKTYGTETPSDCSTMQICHDPAATEILDGFIHSLRTSVR